MPAKHEVELQYWKKAMGGNQMVYIQRTVDAQMTRVLASSGDVVVEGPRAVGKTETSKKFSKSVIHLDLDASARALAAMGSNLLLQGPTPRLIDEWQVESNVWNVVKLEVDRRQLKGQFILTGSASPQEEITRSTGAGRVSRVMMRPLSSFESGHSSGVVSLIELFQGMSPSAAETGVTLSDTIERICIGGWPLYVVEPVEVARRAMQDYVREISGMDVQQVSGVSHDPLRVMNVLRSLARNVGTKTPMATIATDAGGSSGALSPVIVANYLDALARLSITEDVPAWNPHLRSKARIRSAATRLFVDPSLAVAASQASPASLLADLNTTGFLFENLAMRDLRIYAQDFDGQIFQYHDSNGLEVDAIVQSFDGKWAAIEIKLGHNQVDLAADNLTNFAATVDTSKSGAPEFLAVITSHGYAYQRRDGVYVIPIWSLGP
jgi:hypothetical protein